MSQIAAADGRVALDLLCRDSPGERSDISEIVVVEAEALRTKIDNLMASLPGAGRPVSALEAISAVIGGDAMRKSVSLHQVTLSLR